MFLCTVHVTACDPKNWRYTYMQGSTDHSIRRSSHNEEYSCHQIIPCQSENRQPCYQDRSWEPSLPISNGLQGAASHDGRRKQTTDLSRRSPRPLSKTRDAVTSYPLDGMQDNAVANATQSRDYIPDQGQDEVIVDRSTQARLHLTVRREDPPRAPCHFSYTSTAIIGAAFKAPPVQSLPGSFRPREQGVETPQSYAVCTCIILQTGNPTRSSSLFARI
jgi:hypothetical protein